MRTPEEFIEDVGGRRIENHGNPRLRLIRKGWIHSVPEGELEQHKFTQACPCKPDIHEKHCLWMDHHHLGPMPRPLKE